MMRSLLVVKLLYENVLLFPQQDGLILEKELETLTTEWNNTLQENLDQVENFQPKVKNDYTKSCYPGHLLILLER